MRNFISTTLKILTLGVLVLLAACDDLIRFARQVLKRNDCDQNSGIAKKCRGAIMKVGVNVGENGHE